MRVMIVGASNNRAKFGNKAVRAYQRQGHDVLPVNPHGDLIEGAPTWRDVREVPGPIDRVLFYVPPEIGITLVDHLAARGDVGEVWLSPGAESDELVAAAQQHGLDPVLACAIIDVGERPR